MDITISKKSEKEFAFVANNGEKTIDVCASSTLEEGNLGFRPMEMLLTSLGSCMAIDILNILKKQRQKASNFQVRLHGIRTFDIPEIFSDISLKIIIEGEIQEKKLQQAIALSKDKYCSVYKMLIPELNITIQYELNKKKKR